MQLENTATGVDTEVASDAPGGDETGIQALGELLQQSEPKADDDTQAPGKGDSDAGKSQDDKTPLKKFNDAAGMLGIELDDLYKLEVATPDGETITIEALKDLHAKQGEIEMSAIEFEERRTGEEQKLLQAQTELREIMQALPQGAVRPEVLERIRAKHSDQVAQERQRMLEVIPTWTDDKIRETELTGMAQHLSAYGYPVNYLANVVDHKQMKYIRDNWQRELRIKKALAAVKSGKPNPTTKSKPAAKAPTKKPLAGVKRGSHRNKLEAVFSDIE